MAKKSIPTATKIKPINKYVGEVALYFLSKGIRKGNKTYKYVLAARYKPRSGTINTNIWIADGEGKQLFVTPVAELISDSMEDAFYQFGYKLAS